jgi:DUF2075 family protein
MAKYSVEYYESIFPFIKEFREYNLDDELIVMRKNANRKFQDLDESSDDDKVRNYLTKSEYEKFSVDDRNQLALDRYINRSMSKWEIGREYERYIGYCYELEGYNVKYVGIIDGFEDMGRDLICTKNEEILIVQCKCWSKKKTIHEKHINQLYGTAIKYVIDKFKIKDVYELHQTMSEGNVMPVFVTSTKLSDKAISFAKSLGVEVYQNNPLDSYPRIKCHISKRTGEKIYHLPFDQQYDTTMIDIYDDEFYCFSVDEAVENGFRRAYRWRGGIE